MAAGAALGPGRLGPSPDGDAPSPVDEPGALRLTAAGRTLARLDLGAYSPLDPPARGALRSAVRRALPATVTVRAGSGRVTYRIDRAAAVDRALALGTRGGLVPVPVSPRSSSIGARIVAQELRNNCESAALEVLLGTLGVRADQLRLLAELPRSGGLDPVGDGDERVWGDPERGFVGRPEGGGRAGGFGVYQGPVMAVARRRGVGLEDLSGAEPGVLYRRLLAGRAVMVWVGLSDGPYEVWRSPEGRAVRVNLGEHTVVLTGVREDGALSVVNVLEGTFETWSRRRFETMWELLDRRAIAAPIPG